MDKRGLFYSFNEEIKISQLRDNDFDISKYDLSEIQKYLQENDIKYIIDGEGEYHHKFQFIYSKPFVVYYKGNLDLLNKQLLGIVGPRRCSEYGHRIIEDLFERLHGVDLVTVSGLAEGIDTLVHQQSIEKAIPTIAVLGGGFKFFLSNRERKLINSIVNNGGLVLSEFRLGQIPKNYTFPQRNRIIAGLSDLLFVPEAGKKSGSLITVDFANKMNKPVFGVPNSIYDITSRGLNDYISAGKIELVSDLGEFIKNNFEKVQTIKEKSKIFDLSDDERNILDLFEEKEKLDLNDIVFVTNLDVTQIIISLSNLELKNLVKQINPQEYTIVK